MLTDYLLAGVACALARGIVRANGSRAARWWALALLVTGAAAFAGGSVHGFGFAMPRRIEQAVRTATVMSVGVVSASLLAGVVIASVPPGAVRRVLQGLCAAKAVLYLAWTARHPDFRYAAYDSLPAAAVVFVFLVVRRMRGGPPQATLGAVGIGLSLGAAALQQAGLDVHPVWFNHNDLYHLIQAAALWLI